MSLTNFQKEFIKLNLKRFTPLEMADILGCNEKQITGYCYYNGFRYKTRTLVQEDFDYILENYRKLTIDELAKNLNTKKQNIERFLRKQNLLSKKNSTIAENKFTPTEQKVVNLICKKGIVKKKEIAQQMYITPYTVISHIGNIYQKTNCHCIAELIFKYYNGLISECEGE